MTSALVLATAAAGVTGILLLQDYWESDQVASPDDFVSTDLAGNQVRWDLPPDVEGSAVEDTGGSFEAPALDLSVPLLSAELADGVINPPSMTDAFLYRDFGDPDEPGSGLAVVALHAVRDGLAPGNAFVEVSEEEGAPQVTIVPGHELVVDGHRYEVTEVDLLTKDAATRSEQLWGQWPQRDGELVVITCLQRPGQVGNAVENVVLYAERADG